jgi:hypothetical protein
MQDFITNTDDDRSIEVGHCAMNGGAAHAHIEARSLPKDEMAVAPQVLDVYRHLLNWQALARNLLRATNGS